MAPDFHIIMHIIEIDSVRHKRYLVIFGGNHPQPSSILRLGETGLRDSTAHIYL